MKYTALATLMMAASAAHAGTNPAISHKIFEEFSQKPVVFATNSTQSQPALPQVRVDVVFFDLSADVLESIEGQGIEVESISAEYNRAGMALSTLQQLSFLGELPEVQHIYKAIPPITRAGSVESQAVAGMWLTATQQEHTGEGVHIGIISDSIAKREARALDEVDVFDWDYHWPVTGTVTMLLPQISGDMPAEVYAAYDEPYNTNIDEGAAMAEVIHDVAPGAQLSFHSAGAYPSDFAEAIDHLCQDAGTLVEIPYWPKRRPTDPDEYSHGTDPDDPARGLGVDIVVDDIYFFSSLAYQPDVIASAASQCRGRGRLYFSAVGNQGDTAIHQTYNHGSMDASFTASSGVTHSNGHIWNIDGSDKDSMEVTLDAGQKLYAILHWNQPALSPQATKTYAPQIDLDLVARVKSSGVIPSGGYSSEVQNNGLASADPVEMVAIENLSDSPVTYELQVYHASGNTVTIPQDSGQPIEFRLSFVKMGGGSGYPVYSVAANGQNIAGQNVSPDVLSIAAVPFWESPVFNMAGGPTSEIDPEPFSNEGGQVQTQFDANGIYVKTTAYKPDVAAIDGVNTTFFGSDFDDGDDHPNFFGTSAAAPNAAALAAVYMDASGHSYSASELEQALLCSAIDVKGDRSAPGWDSATGVGLLVDALPIINIQGTTQVDPGASTSLTIDAQEVAYPIDSSSWTFIAGPNGNSNYVLSNGGKTITLTTSDSDSGTYRLLATTSDSCGITNTKTVLVSVGVDNSAPIISPITSDNKDGVEPFNLSADISEPDGAISSITWSQVSGPFATVSQATDKLSARITPSATGLYTFAVTAVNASGLETIKTIDVNVISAVAPVFQTTSTTTFSQDTGDALLTIFATHPYGREVVMDAPSADSSGVFITLYETATGPSTSDIYQVSIPTTAIGTYTLTLHATVPETGMSSTKTITYTVKATGQTPDVTSPSKSSGGGGGGSIPFGFVFSIAIIAAVSRRRAG